MNIPKASNLYELSHPAEIHLDPFRLDSYEPINEYFSIARDVCGQYFLYSIGQSLSICPYTERFQSADEAMVYFNQLPERIFYFREHPPVLVELSDLIHIRDLRLDEKNESTANG